MFKSSFLSAALAAAASMGISIAHAEGPTPMQSIGFVGIGRRRSKSSHKQNARRVAKARARR